MAPGKSSRFVCSLDAELIGISPTEVIEFDVSVSLDPIKAGADGISIMPIALLKLDSIYLPGTTIAASYFIAYAMTKGMYTVYLHFALY
jgi:hypothetical protein